MKVTKLVSTAALAIGLTIAFYAHADNQFISAGACQLYVYNGASVKYKGDGSISNPSANTLYVTCPIDRGDFGTNGDLVGKAFGIDRSSTANVCCTWYSHNAASSSYTVSSQSCTGGSSTSYQSMDATVLGHIGSWDYAYALCEIPAINGIDESSLTGFRGVEQ